MESLYFPLFHGIVSVSIFAPAAFWLICVSEGTAAFACIMAASAVHEAGHLFFVRVSGESVTTFRIEPFGGMMTYTTSSCSYGDEMLIAAGGVIFNLLAAFAASVVFAFFRNEYLLLFIFSCFFFAAVNIVPLSKNDGNRFVYLALCRRTDEESAKKAASVLAVCGSILLLCLSVFILYVSDFNNGLCIIFLLAAIR